MKNTTSKHKRLKTTLALGASTLAVASSHAAIVYLDTTGLDLTVNSIPNTDSYESLSIYYDSANHLVALGGSYGPGQDRGVTLWCMGKNGKGNFPGMNPEGSSTAYGFPSRCAITNNINYGGISTETKIDGNIHFDDGWNTSFNDIDSYFAIRLWANETEGEYNYGWAHITTPVDGLSATLNGIAFETEINTGIQAGDKGISAVPEPGNVLSLAALVGSAAFMRTRRKAAATAA